MKSSTKLALALSAVMAIAAQTAGAAPTADNTLYVSGATAVDRTLFEAIVDQTNGICDSTNAVTVYSNGTTSADSVPKSYGNFMVHCTARDTTSFGGTVEIGISKTSQGSEYGIDPVANGATTLTVNGSTVSVTSLTTTCTASKTVAVSTANTRLGYTFFYGCSTATTQAPQAGVSDVEPALFGASGTVKARLTNNGAATVPFTMFVSKNFFRALQTAQGLTGACLTDTALTQTDACTPNLNMVQVRAILSGYVSTVSGLYAGSTALTAPSGGDSLLVCRRANSSGSQRSVERLFFNQNCKATPAVTFVKDDSVVNASSQPCLDVGCSWSNTTPTGAGGVAENFIFQGTGTGDVESCMNWAAGTFTGGGAAGAASVDAGNGIYAVGIASADRTPDDTNTTSGKQYRYIKIDGVLPSVENVLAQKWQHTTENVVLTPTAASPNTTAYNTGLRPTIANAVLTQLRVPANLAKSANTTYATGRIGLTTRPSATQTPAATDTASVRPLAPFLRAADASNAPVNNCNENFISIGSPVKAN